MKLSQENAQVFFHAPREALRPFVKRFVVVEFPFDRTLTLLPDTSFLAEFRLRGDGVLDGRASLPRAAISGLWDTARTRTYPAGTAILLAVFTEVGAKAFLRNSLDTLFNTTAAMEHVVDGTSELGLRGEELEGVTDNARRVEAAEEFLLRHAHDLELDPFVSNALACIEETQGTVRIEELSRRVGLSQSALERRFRRSVGTSPKHFESILRFKSALRLRASGQDLTWIAHSAGYSDQSHFNKDFKQFTGLAPSQFFDQTIQCKNAEFLQVAFARN